MEVPLPKRKKLEARFFVWLLTDEHIGLASIVSTKTSSDVLRDIARVHERTAEGEHVTDIEVERLRTRLRRAGRQFEKAGNDTSSTALLCAYCSTLLEADNRLDVALSWADNAHAYYGGCGFIMPAAACDFFEKAEAKAREICRR